MAVHFWTVTNSAQLKVEKTVLWMALMKVLTTAHYLVDWMALMTGWRWD